MTHGKSDSGCTSLSGDLRSVRSIPLTGNISRMPSERSLVVLMSLHQRRYESLDVNNQIYSKVYHTMCHTLEGHGLRLKVVFASKEYACPEALCGEDEVLAFLREHQRELRARSARRRWISTSRNSVTGQPN